MKSNGRFLRTILGILSGPEDFLLFRLLNSLRVWMGLVKYSCSVSHDGLLAVLLSEKRVKCVFEAMSFSIDCMISL